MANKSLAVLGAGAAILCVSVAQADVTIYGKVHVSVDNLDDGTDSTIHASSNSSRIGFKGDSAMEGGKKLIWQYEGTVDVEGGGSGIASRNSFIGLQSDGMGKILAGRYDTPMKIIGRKADFFPDQIGDSRNLLNNTADNFDTRSSLTWVSPDYSGVNVMATYTPEDGTLDDELLGASVLYKKGPLMVGGAFESHGMARAGGANDSSGIRVMGGYSFGDAKVKAIYESLTDLEGISGNDLTVIGVGGAYKMNKMKFKAQYYTADDIGNTTGTAASMIALGVDYKMDKATTAYVAFASTSNDPAADYSAFGGGHGDQPAITVGQDATGLSVGLIHKF